MKWLVITMITVFLMAAFAIGVTLQDEDMPYINEMITNSSIIVSNMTTPQYNNSYMDGIVNVLGEFCEFVMVAGMEVMRMGITFGHDNPDYFEPDFIMRMAKLLIYFMVISMLIVPIMYLIAFLIMLVIWIKGLFSKRKKKDE